MSEDIHTDENILPEQTQFAKQNIVFIIDRTYRCMKNSQSVSCSAIVGNKRCRRNCWHVYTDNQICIITVFTKKFHYE